jgi:Zn-finger nucleic acid-binding protein
MKCPVCDSVELLMAERQGVEIDYCPGCRGVWLDRGELDKIVERSGELSAAPAGKRDVHGDEDRDARRDTHYDDHGHDSGDNRSKKKKGGLFGDLLGGLGG